MGSAYKNKGVQKLLDAIIDYLPAPYEVPNEAFDQDADEGKVNTEINEDKPLVALAFKLEETRFGQLTFMRLYQGTMRKGDTVINVNAFDKKVKIPRLVRMHADEMVECDQAVAGDIVAVFGVECASGDTFTDGKVRYTMASIFVPEAVMSLAVSPKDRASQTNFSKALGKFTREDPTFRVHRDEESNETIISGMGELHLEIYVERMKREFACECVVGQPQVNYRETITKRVDMNYTHKKQTGGSGQFARVVGYMEPVDGDPSATTMQFVDEIVGGAIPRQFISAIEKGYQEQMKTGQLCGAPMTGMKFVINDGLHHPVDSSEIAFKVCAMTMLREFFHEAAPVILEPIMRVGVEGPEEFQGAMMGLINQRRGMVASSSNNASFVEFESEVPLSEMFGFSTALRSATQGKGEFQMTFARYHAVPRNVQEELIDAFKKKRAAEHK
jgi:elongation factor G